MFKSTLAAVVLAAVAMGNAYAEDQATQRKATPQQQRMSDCSKQAKAKSLKGDERRSFMRECLRTKHAS